MNLCWVNECVDGRPACFLDQEAKRTLPPAGVSTLASVGGEGLLFLESLSVLGDTHTPSPSFHTPISRSHQAKPARFRSKHAPPPVRKADLDPSRLPFLGEQPFHPPSSRADVATAATGKL